MRSNDGYNVSKHNTARTYIGYGPCYGDGCGYGRGYGYGDADGHGHGDGDGKIIAYIDDHVVKIRPPFNIIVVGCQAHTVENWRQHWREIAQGEDVDVTKEEVAKILALVEAT